MYYFKKIYVLTGLIYVHIFGFVSCMHWYKSEPMKEVSARQFVRTSLHLGFSTVLTLLVEFSEKVAIVCQVLS